MKPGTPMPNPLGGDDLAVMNPGVAHPGLLEPAGPTDPEVAYLSVQAIDGRPLALLANYSLHYVGGVPQGHISADYLPFETFAETGLEIKEKSPFSKTFTISFANGSFGYLPTPRQHQLGGYETWLSTNRVEEVASEKIVAQLLNLFSSMD